MIQTMREMAQSLFARVLIGIIIVLLLLFGYGSFDVFNRADMAVADVNGTEVARADYEREIEMQRRMAEGRVDDAKLRSDVLERMIKRALLLDTAADLGLSVAPTEVDRMITSDPAFVEDGKFSQTLYLQRLMGAGIRPADYRRSVEESALIEQVQRGVVESEFLTPAELRRIEGLANQQRDLAWVDVDPSSFAAIARVDDAAAQRYFAANAARFRVPESVVVDYIRIGAAAIDKSITVSDAEIQAEYERATGEARRAGEKRRVAHIQLTDKAGRTRQQATALLQAAAQRIAARVRATKAKDRLASVKGELAELAYEQSLADLAKRYGVQVERSAPIPRAGVAAGIGGNAAVRTAAFANDVRDGEFNSGVLDVGGDLVVLRVAKYEAARPLTFAEAKPRVIAEAQRERQVQLARERAERLVADVRRSGSLTPSIQALAVTWQSRAQTRRDSTEVPAPILEAAFTLPRPGGANKATGKAVTLPGGHVAAVVVSRVVDGVGFGAAEQAMLRAAFSRQSGQRLFEAYLERLEADGDIELRAAPTEDASPAG